MKKDSNYRKLTPDELIGVVKKEYWYMTPEELKNENPSLYGELERRRLVEMAFPIIPPDYDKIPIDIRERYGITPESHLNVKINVISNMIYGALEPLRQLDGDIEVIERLYEKIGLPESGKVVKMRILSLRDVRKKPENKLKIEKVMREADEIARNIEYAMKNIEENTASGVSEKEKDSAEKVVNALKSYADELHRIWRENF